MLIDGAVDYALSRVNGTMWIIARISTSDNIGVAISCLGFLNMLKVRFYVNNCVENSRHV